MIRLCAPRTPLLVIIVLLVLSSELSQAQFTATDYTHDKGTYFNYSGRNYENYSLQFLRRKIFDNFGNYLVDGLSVFDLSEDQRQSSASNDIGGTSSLTKTRYYQNYFNNLAIVNDYYGGFSTRLMVGDAIRTKFTSLTFDKARFNGIRWDAGTSKYRATAIASRISDPIRFSFDNSTLPTSPVTGTSAVSRIRNWTQYLFGGHFETDIGDVATVGATYVNQHQQRANLSSDESSMRGVVANAIPRVVFIRVSDDSPGDDSGPRVFSPPSVVINNTPKTTRLMSRYEEPPQDYTLGKSPILYYVFYNFSIDYGLYTNDTLSHTNYDANGGGYSGQTQTPSYPYDVAPTFRANITYAYVMPEGTTSLSFYVPLANDYKVEMAEDYVNVRDEYKIDNAWVPHTRDSVTLPQPKPTFFRMIKEAEGNVKDGSNKQLVRVDYGLVSGMSVYGLNFDFHWNGFKLQGEIDQSVEFFKYPVIKGGNIFDLGGAAWYVRGSKEIGRLTLGGEVFKIEPTYTTALNIWTMDNSYYSSVTAPYALPTTVPPDFSGYDVGTLSPTQSPYLTANNNAGGAYYALVDDNDDNDRWEDGFYFYNVIEAPLGNNDVLNPTGVPNYWRLGYRQNANELQSLDAVIRRPDAGIFPGRDADGDGIPDDDRNSNGVPDYQEDFLTYYSDPPSFLWGDDWNNNGVIDAQENDILPDYPYPPDQQGFHLFAKLNIAKGFDFTTGFIREMGIAKGGVDNVNYARFLFETSSPRLGALTLFYVAKRVHDNIPNDVYLFPKNQITASQPIPTYSADPLNYLNSMVHNMYVGVKFTQVRNLTIENTVRVELNSQAGLGNVVPGTTYVTDPTRTTQQEASLRGYGVVSKIDYVIPIIQAKLAVTPQFKIRTEKVVRVADRLMPSGKVLPFTEIVFNTQEIIPILKLDYRLTDNTDLRFGLQGFSAYGLTDMFQYQYRDFKSDEFDNTANTFLFAVANRSQYAGYNLVVNFGFKVKDIEYQREIDKVYSGTQTQIFFSLFAGF